MLRIGTPDVERILAKPKTQENILPSTECFNDLGKLNLPMVVLF
jgi:hypothetical protein